jgi:PAS domain-containing protein
MVTQRFASGFEPFSDYCRLQAGLLCTIPRLYGFAPATVIEEACQCDGADACRLRVTWEEVDELTQRVEYLEYYTQLLETRLAGLQHTVTDLVGNENLETILEKTVASARRAVMAPSYVLSLVSLSAATRNVYRAGLDEAAAADVAARLLSGDPDDRGMLAVDVRSSTRCYGRLAAFDPSGIRTYIPEERTVLTAFASVAAAALEVASSLDDSRRQTARAEAMSELLSRIVEGLPHGVGWTDSSGAIEGCNQALADLLDCTLDTVKGRLWADLCDDEAVANQCTSWAEQVVSRCEPVINAEMTVTVGDERRVVLVSVVPLS